MIHTVSDKSIEELRQIAEAEFGRPFTTAEAQEMADTLIQLYDLLARSLRRA